MAATSYAKLPFSTTGGFGDSHISSNHGTYDAGIGSLTAHPYQYQINNHGAHHTDNQPQSLFSNTDHPDEQPPQIRTDHQHQSNGHTDSHTLKKQDRSRTMTINNNGNYGTTKITQLSRNRNMENKPGDLKDHQQKPNPGKNQHRPPAPIDKQPNLVRSERQINNRPPKRQQQKSQPPPQSDLDRSDHQHSKARATPPLIHQHTPSDDPDNHIVEKVSKTNGPPKDLKPTKSSLMRAAANKKKEETLEQKRKGQFFPIKLKSQQASPETDVEQSDFEKSKHEKKQSRSLSKTEKSVHSDGERTDTEKSQRHKKPLHSQGKQRKSRRDDHRTDDDNNSSGDDDHHHERQRSKSRKRGTYSDSHLERHPHLPPLHHGRVGRHHDPHLDHPLPSGHPLRRHYPYDDYPPYRTPYGRYSRHHLHDDADDIPPYLAPYHDPYDPFFDYQKRKAQPKHPSKDKNDHHTDHEDANGGETDRDDGAKSRVSRKGKQKNYGGRKSHHDHDDMRRSHWPPGYYPPEYPPDYYQGEDMLEVWRQERNDYLKKKFKPTIHDVLYSQQWMKSDSYLENQRRRVLRDVQGYYFPYRKYTLKDYKQMQKLNNQNPYAELPEATIDRKERAKKRQEYGTLVERQIVDHPHARHVPAQEMGSRKPWHLNDGEIQDRNAASKRERALEYAKVQVKYRPMELQNAHSNRSEPSEQHVNNFSLDATDDGDRSNNQETGRIHQSYDDAD